MPAINRFDYEDMPPTRYFVIVGPDINDLAAMCNLLLGDVINNCPFAEIVGLDHLCPDGPSNILATIGTNGLTGTDTVLLLTNVFGGRNDSGTVIDDDDGNEVQIDDPLTAYGYPGLLWTLSHIDSDLITGIFTMRHLTAGLNRAEHDDGNEESDHQFSAANTLPAVDSFRDAQATFVLLPGVPVPDVLDAFGTDIAAIWIDTPNDSLLTVTDRAGQLTWCHIKSPLPSTSNPG